MPGIGDRLPVARTYSQHELKLIKGTYAVVARIGAQQLSLRNIARELRVSPSLLKYHFGDRETLMLETMRWALDGTVQRVHRRIDGIDDAESAMTALLDAVFVSPRANRDFYLIYLDLVRYALLEPNFAGVEEMARSHITQSYSAVIQMGVDADVFHVADVENAAEHARAIVEGGFLQWLHDPDWATSHTALHRMCRQAILRLLRVREGDPSRPG